MKLKPLRRLFLPKLELGWGGTGNLPVPLGHRPNGMERRLAMEAAVRKNPNAPSHSDGRVAGRDGRPATANMPATRSMAEM